MAFAFDDVNKVLFESVQPDDFPGLFIVSRTFNPAALADIAALKAIPVPVDFWKVSGGNIVEMTAPEKLVQETTVMVPRLRTVLKNRLISNIQAYLDSRYSPTILILLGVLFNAEVSSNARQNYIAQAYDWVVTVLATFNTARAAFDASTTLVALNAVTYDFTPFDGTDPLITIQGALAL